MKNSIKGFLAVAVFALVSCGGKEEKKENVEMYDPEESTEVVTTTETTTSATDMVDLDNKGIGPVKNLTLGATVDQAMASAGEEVYKSKCLACHKTDKKFIGPAPKGILDRRSPEWVMNMILNPEEMVQKDPIAKALLVEYNGSPMANQGLTETEARQVLEYFRTL